MEEMVEFTCVDGMTGMIQPAYDAITAELGDPALKTAKEIKAWHRAHPEYWVCDFCYAQPVTFSFPAEDLPGSEGEWLACDPCARAIVTKDSSGLLARAIEADPEHTPVQIARVHVMFYEARKGSPVTVEEVIERCQRESTSTD
jgi:hypothetical protein